MKKNNLAIIIIFITFLILPSILFWFVNDKMDNTNYENRDLYEKPDLKFNDITNFPKNFENYFNDNLAFKNEIRKIRSKLMLNLFNISSDERVIVGKEKWFFYTGDSTITDLQKTKKYTKKQKKKIKDSLLSTQEKLSEKNIDFYILILPNKETVYNDKLKNIINISNNKKSKIDDLIDYLNKNSDLKIVYPKDDLVKNRKNYETYYKYDTHWNDYGSYFGVMQLMKVIDPSFEIPKVEVKKKIVSSGDLAIMNLMSNVKNKEPKTSKFYDEIEYKCDELETYKTCDSDNAIYDKTLLFVGDSFRIATAQYFSKIYKKSIIIHKNNYNEDFIKQYNPDIVVYEAVERLSDTLMNTDILFNQNKKVQ